MYKKVTTIKEYFGAKPKHTETYMMGDSMTGIIKVDLPTLTSLLEYAKANLTDEAEFGNFARAILEAMGDDDALTMEDYPLIMDKIRSASTTTAA